MEDNFSSIVEYCDSCNLSFEPWSIRLYEILYQGSKIHDQNKIRLCYICSKIAKYAEQLFYNLQGNYVKKPEFHINKQPIKNLSIFNLGTLQLSDDDSCDTDTRYSIISAKNGEILTECGKKDIKIENNLNELELGDDAINSCDDELEEIKQENVNEEDNIPHKDLISTPRSISGSEINNSIQPDVVEESDETNIKQEFLNEEDNTPHKDLISGIDTKKDEKRDTNKIKIVNSLQTEENSYIVRQSTYTIVHLTTEQYLQEKLDRSKSEKYLNSQFICTDCVLGFFNKKYYLKHMERHKESAGQYECDFCKQRIYTKDKLRLHIRAHLNRYKCMLCNFMRHQHRSIRDHLYSVHKIGIAPTFECDKCPKIYTSKWSLQFHMKAKHRQHINIRCAYCQKIYISMDTLNRHIKRMHPDILSREQQGKGHFCQECGAAFRTPFLLKAHLAKHSDTRDYYCVECDKGFKTVVALKAHLTTTLLHLKDSELPLPCSQCERRFSTKRSLELHINSVHLKVKPYQCDQCSKRYSSTSTLNNHHRIAHEGYKTPRKHKCEICSKTFRTKRVMNAHTRTHTGERPYKCDKCDDAFTHSGSLHTHNKLVHLKLKRNGKKRNKKNVRVDFNEEQI